VPELVAVAVPVKVNVVFTVAACAPAEISSASARGANLVKRDPVKYRIVCLLRTGLQVAGIPALYNELLET
jgi:hypothetical protein